jgi:hypothetical protein
MILKFLTAAFTLIQRPTLEAVLIVLAIVLWSIMYFGTPPGFWMN